MTLIQLQGNTFNIYTLFIFLDYLFLHLIFLNLKIRKDFY